jgi:hypothetical protein
LLLVHHKEFSQFSKLQSSSLGSTACGVGGRSDIAASGEPVWPDSDAVIRRPHDLHALAFANDLDRRRRILR